MTVQMRHLLLTTALISVIAAVPLRAQTNTDAGNTAAATDADTQLDTGTADTAGFTPPEGFTEFETASLTAEDLQGATIYDANGESVGEITDFVFDTGVASTTDTASTTTGGTTATEDATTDMATTDTGTGNATDTTAGSGTSDTDVASGETDLTPDADGTDIDTANDTATGSTTTDMAEDTGEAIDDLAATGSVEADTGESVDMAGGRITHVVLDVGGFLGIGAHTVAVPLDELQVFRDEGSDVRVYLPWTEAQLEALPEYDETAGAAPGAAPTDTDGDGMVDEGTTD